MKNLYFILALFLSLGIFAQGRKYSTFYEQRATLFESLPISSQDIVFVGNSITNGGEWSELFSNPLVKNRGISGDITNSVLDRLDAILKGKPAKLFLMIGVNDIAHGLSADSIAVNLMCIVDRIRDESPQSSVYLQSVLPVNADFNMFKGHMKPLVIKEVNSHLQQIAQEKGLTYIDLYSSFVVEGTDKMNPLYTNDGLHLLGRGYVLWRDLIKPYITD